MTQPSDDRSPLAIGMGWATAIMALSAQMVVPALLGYWLDQRLGTRLLFLLMGLALGVSWGILGLVRVARQTMVSPDSEDDGGQSKQDPLD